MSQNRGTTDPQNRTPRSTGGASTGATDAGTTRDTPTTGTTGSATTSMTPTSSPQSASSTAQGLAAQAKDQAQVYGQKISDAATQAKDYVSDKVSVVSDKFKDLQNVDINQVAEDAKEYARQKPGQALLISAAAGFLLGLVFRSSRR